jgi:HEPN domain-containing protein
MEKFYMPDLEKVIIVVNEWVDKAENDFKNAAYTLEMGDECPTDTVCFHAQQCIEKYLKALLTYKDISFPKTHDIEALVVSLPNSLRPNLNDKEQSQLADYATVTRYPGDYEPISLNEARKAVAMARRIRREIRKLLPKRAAKKRDTK